MAPAAEPILQFFTYAHLPLHLQSVSEPFASLAADIVKRLPRNPERTVALRKLLEAKDAAVRAVLYQEASAVEPAAPGGDICKKPGCWCMSPTCDGFTGDAHIPRI